MAKSPINCINTYGHWSISALECFYRQFKCEGCFFETFFSDPKDKCKMKFSVLKIISNIGFPDGFKPEEKILEDSLIESQYVTRQIKRQCEKDFGKQIQYKPPLKLGVLHRRAN